jgi:aspartate/methionine/tyrosine aminotransferase
LLQRAPAFRAPLLSRLRNNLLALQTSLAGSAASVLRAEGGWYAVVRLPDLASEEQWVLGLLERGRVLTHPGYFYDFSETGPHLVLSLLAREDVWRRGVEAIRGEVDRRVRSG